MGYCMCGATDCPSCGTAQGYEVVKINGMWVNPEYCARCNDAYVAEEGDLCDDCRDYVCPKCNSMNTDIGWQRPDGSWYNECNDCNHQWDCE
jgi:ssDNA-binding Zn-finger/Zn-ribbon topoisomerase 1